MKRTDPKLVSAIIDEALGDSGMTSTFNEHKAAHLWCEIVGPGVNRYTFKRFVDNGTLHVYITSAALKQELSFHRASLVARINDAVGTQVINDIKFH